VVLEALVFLARADYSLLAPTILPKLEHLALDWLLEQGSYVEARFMAELQGLKDRVSACCGCWGWLAVLLRQAVPASG
jgi:hypothetical protein